MEIKAVIGANYGDEGKGLVTDFLVEKALKSKKNCLVVLNNGGAQRGHTVIRSKIRHVFHHFGSGTLQKVPTFISGLFIINPIVFMDEYKELVKYGVYPKAYISENAIVSTPYDMIINHIVSMYRKVHNSCGLGIWETECKRNKGWEIKTINWFIDHLKDNKVIREYLNERKEQLFYH